MMVIALRKVEENTGIDTTNMVEKAKSCIRSMNTPEFPDKKINWGPPSCWPQ